MMSKLDAKIAKYNEERNEALRTMDMKWGAAHLPRGASAEAIEMAMHKARYECCGIDSALRLDSGEWLRKRGLGRLGGGPLLPPGELP